MNADARCWDLVWPALTERLRVLRHARVRPVECDEAVAARISGCQLIRMPGMDHLPALREPGLVTQTILRQCERAG